MTSTLATGTWRWIGDEPPVRDRVLVLAPHPDDEVLGMGGLLMWLAERGAPITIVAVTDGEWSHRRSHRISPAELRTRRAEERTQALTALGVDADVVRLARVDGAVAADDLAAPLGALITPRTTVVSPFVDDGHPDHEAVAVAARQACVDAGAAHWQVPIWAKVATARSGLPLASRSVLQLPAEAVRRKAEAAACFESQLVGLSLDPVDGPVVRPEELAAMLDGREQLEW